MKTAKHSFKRYLAFLLALVLVMSNISVTAYAEDTASVPDDEIIIAQEETLSDPENDASLDFETLENENAEPSDTEIFDEEAEDSSAEQSLEDDLIEETLEETVSDDQESDISDAASENEDAGTDEDVIAQEMPAFSRTVKVDGGEISVYAPDGVFPEDALLSVEMLPADIQKDADAAADPLRDTEREIVASYTFDIKVLAGDGVTVLEPADDTNIRILFSFAEISDQDLETVVYRIRQNKKTGKLSAQAMEILAEEAARDFPVSYDPAVTAAVETDELDYCYTVEFIKSRQEDEPVGSQQRKAPARSAGLLGATNSEGPEATYSLTTNKPDAAAGTVSVQVNGTAVQQDADGYVYGLHTGDVITVTILPGVGYELSTLRVDNQLVSPLPEDGVYTYTVGETNASVKAIFAAKKYTVSAESVPNTSIWGFSKSVEAGTSVTFYISSDANEITGAYITYMQEGVEVQESAEKLSYETFGWSFTMPAADVTLHALWAGREFSLTTMVEDNGGYAQEGENAHGSISFLVNGVEATTAKAGDTITVTATADDGYHVERIRAMEGYPEVDRVVFHNEPETGTLTFEMPANNVSLRAVFALNTHWLWETYELDQSEGFDYLGKSQQSYVVGDEVSFWFVLTDAEYETLSVSCSYELDGETVTFTPDYDETTGKYTFTMPAANVSVDGQVARKTYPITINSATGLVELTGPQNGRASMDTSVSIVVKPWAGYRWDTITVTDADGEILLESIPGDNASRTFIMPNKAVTVDVTYKKIHTVTLAEKSDNYCLLYPTQYVEGKTVEVQVTLFTLPDGHRFDGLRVLAGETEIATTEVEDSRSGYRTFQFTMPDADVTLEVLHTQYRFSIIMQNGDATSNKYYISGTNHAGGGTFSAVEGNAIIIAANGTLEANQQIRWTVTDADTNEAVEVTPTSDNARQIRFAMPARNLKVYFEVVPMPLHSVTLAGELADLADVDKAVAGEGKVVTVTPDPDWVGTIFYRYMLNGSARLGRAEMTDSGDWTFVMPQADENSDVTVFPLYRISEDHDEAFTDFSVTPETVTVYENASYVAAGTKVKITFAKAADSVFNINEYSYANGTQTGTVAFEGEIDGANQTQCTGYFTMPASDVALSLFAGAQPEISYIEYSWRDGALASITKTITSYRRVANVTSMPTGTYVLDQNITFKKSLEITGDVKLILLPHTTLTAPDGIYIHSDASLSIYGTPDGDGEIDAHAARSAGIGGRYNTVCGDLFVHGGTIEASGDAENAGIGGGYGSGGYGQIVIYAGYVSANGGKNAAGIGKGNGNRPSKCGNILIYGGNVTAKGGSEAAGIGGSANRDGGNIQIYGGDVTAKGADGAAGIGGGKEGTAGAAYISGGTVYAYGGGHGAAIGSGFNTKTYSGSVTITGGNVTAEGGHDSAGIGGGDNGGLKNITINGGTVDAKGNAAAGIGGGKNYGAGTILITGGTVDARSESEGWSGAGIGGGLECGTGSITITDGAVTAWGYNGGAGIGAGASASFTGTVTISAGTVTAGSYSGGAGIGAGKEGDFVGEGGECEGIIDITGGTVTAIVSKSNAQAIGHGEDGGTPGTFKLYDEAKLSAGNKADGSDATLRTVDKWDWARRNTRYVHIEPCDHPDEGKTYTLGDDAEHNHIWHCAYCKITGTEEHSWDGQTCTVCGYEDGHVCTVTFRDFESDQTMEAKVPIRGIYVLPECGFTAPDHRRFKNWILADGDNESIQPGTQVVVEQDLEYQAVWETLYDVVVNPDENGKGNVIASAAQAGAGDKVTVAIGSETARGYELTSVAVKDENQNDIELSESMEFTMPAGSVTVTPTFDHLTHSYTFKEFVWADNENGAPSATLVMGCDYCDETLNIPATVTEMDTPGLYKAQASYDENQYTDFYWSEMTWEILQRQINADIDSFTLTKDLIAEETDTALTIPSGMNVTIDLNGHTIDRALSEPTPDGSVFMVYGALTIQDSAGGGKITGGSTTGQGGGIYVDHKGYLTLEGGTITGNNASGTGNNGKGGGVYVGSGGMYMSGGSITGNTSEMEGAGVYLLIDGDFYVDGSVQITGNTRGGAENNVSMGRGALIHMANLAADSRIGVTVKKLTEAFASGSSADGKASFLSDDPYYTVEWVDEDNPEELILREPLRLAVYSTDTDCSGSVANVTVSPAKAGYEPGESVTVKAEEKQGYSFLGWYAVTGVSESRVTGYGDKLAETLAYTFDITKDTQITAVYEAKGKATVKIIAVNGAKYMVGDDTTIKTGSQENVPIGTTLKLTAADADQVFQWQNESEKILGTGSTLEYYVTSNTTITLVYQYDAENQSYVQFVSDYGQVLSYNQYSVSSTIDFPVSPTKYGYTFDKWVFEGTEDEATAETIKAKIGTEKIITLKPKYTKDEAVGSVTVNYKAGNEEIADTSTTANIPVGNTKTFTAKDIEGYTFECWKDAEGTVLGYQKNYFMQITGTHELNACYVAEGGEVEEAKPTIVIGELEKVTSGSTHKVRGSVTRSIPEGYTLIEHGILYARDKSGLNEDTFVYSDGTDGIGKYHATDTAMNGVVGLGVKVASDNVVVSLRGYMVLKNDSTEEVVYYYTDIKEGSFQSIK